MHHVSKSDEVVIFKYFTAVNQLIKEILLRYLEYKIMRYTYTLNTTAAGNLSI